MTIQKTKTAKQRWLDEVYGPAVKRRPERKSRFSTLSDDPVDPLYTADDLEGFDPDRDLGCPGEFPYTRGVQPSMHRGRLWTMRQFAGFGSAEDSNERFHYLMTQGVTGLSVAFDMPTLMGRDSDDPLSRGEVGREGVAVDSLRDMEILFDRIPLDQVTTSMTINGPASIVWAMYLANAEKRGIPLDRLGGTIQNDCLKEYIERRYHPRNERALLLRTHAQTAGVSLTAQQPYNNVVRVTLQALAAVLGGTQSLHTNSLDETYALPTKEAVTLALRTQQVIAHESGVADTIDPLAGSYYLEHLTQRMEEGFARYLAEIEKFGGMVEAVERGYPQREITESAFHFQQQVDEGEKVIVGINKYATEREPPIPTLAIDPEVERKQVERLAETRRTRDKARWKRALDELREAAKTGDELMPRFLECARAYASVGEQVAVLKDVYGVYHDPGYF